MEAACLAAVIPGRCNASNPESRDSGSGANAPSRNDRYYALNQPRASPVKEKYRPAAAGVIHTDFEKGFIRAETIAYADYVALGGEAGARDAGKLRLEGKEYVVADGDVMHFRFNT